MTSLDRELAGRLSRLEQAGLRRQLRSAERQDQGRIRTPGGVLVDFASNDYLGLARHPILQQRAITALERHGVGAGAARLISGNTPPHLSLESHWASFQGTEAALAFSSGYAAAVGVIPALVGSGDVVVMDRSVHACLVDGARLSGAKLRVFRHNDLDDLEHVLTWVDRSWRRRRPDARVLVVSESVFSMDGDRAPIDDLIRLKSAHGAWLMMDEAHAVGWAGPEGCGLIVRDGGARSVDVQMATLGKSAGVAGGIVAGSRVLIDYLMHRARSFVFSTAPPPALAEAAHAAIDLIRGPWGDERREALAQRVALFRQAAGLPADEAHQGSPIVPWIVGESATAVALSERLIARGWWVPAIRYPTVRRGRAQLRISLKADLPLESVAELAVTLNQLIEKR